MRARTMVLSVLLSVLGAMIPTAALALPPMVTVQEVPNAGPRPVCLMRGRASLTSNGWGNVVAVDGWALFGDAGDYRATVTCTERGTAVLVVAGPSASDGTALISALTASMTAPQQ